MNPRLATSPGEHEKHWEWYLDQKTMETYDSFAELYLPYADGDVISNLYQFVGRPYAYADQKTWDKLKSVIRREIAAGKKTIRVLDVGCGPGTWLLRLTDTFTGEGIRIQGIGFDNAPRMVALANWQKKEYCKRHPELRVELSFLIADTSQPFDFDDNAFDLSLCLYTVLNHLEDSKVRQTIKEMRRVTRGTNLTSFRGVGGIPTSYACSMEDVLEFTQQGDMLTFKHRSGRKGCLRSQLFTFSELLTLFSEVSEVEECIGLDIFLSRFQPIRSWTGERVVTLPGFAEVQHSLHEIEESYCRNPAWIDFANHILIISGPKSPSQDS